ncbi:MAG: hypothetical protein AAGA29_08965 [Planctomycetota bacterium]
MTTALDAAGTCRRRSAAPPPHPRYLTHDKPGQNAAPGRVARV